MLYTLSVLLLTVRTLDLHKKHQQCYIYCNCHSIQKHWNSTHGSNCRARTSKWTSSEYQRHEAAKSSKADKLLWNVLPPCRSQWQRRFRRFLIPGRQTILSAIRLSNQNSIGAQIGVSLNYFLRIQSALSKIHNRFWFFPSSTLAAIT